MNNKVQINIKEINSSRLLAKYLQNEEIDFDYQSNFEIISTRKSLTATRSIMLTALIAGLIGFLSVILFQYWAGIDYYRLNIGNKPMFALITALPYAFEIAVLFAGIAAFAVFLWMTVSNGNKMENADTENVKFIIEANDLEKCKAFCNKNNINYVIDEKIN